MKGFTRDVTVLCARRSSEPVSEYTTTGETRPMHRKWNKDAIALEILSMYESGENLNYSSVAGNNLSLLRAATRYFGTWEDAVRFAGLDYDSDPPLQVLDPRAHHRPHQRTACAGSGPVLAQCLPERGPAACRRRHQEEPFRLLARGAGSVRPGLRRDPPLPRVG